LQTQMKAKNAPPINAGNEKTWRGTTRGGANTRHG
jgi:hypothetical protein